jgi:TolB-like protein
MSGDRENEYLSDGITEELIHALANVEGIRVSSRTSAFAFKGKDVGVRKIGEELQVSTVLEGSVRREGGSVRVTAQLVNAADGYHIWSKTYDRELKNMFALEDELARSIAQALAPRLGAREPAALVRPPTASTAAHDDYLKGRYVWNQRTPESLRKAISFFQQAIAEDPLTRSHTRAWPTPISCSTTTPPLPPQSCFPRRRRPRAGRWSSTVHLPRRTPRSGKSATPSTT